MDLSTDFNTIDHDKLLAYFSDYLGFGDRALKLIKSYSSDWTQCAHINEILSKTTKLICESVLKIPAILHLRYHICRWHITLTFLWFKKHFASAIIIHAFINIELDYCYSLLYGLSDFQNQRLQKNENIADRILFKSKNSPPILELPHWLHLRRRPWYTKSLLRQ